MREASFSKDLAFPKAFPYFFLTSTQGSAFFFGFSKPVLGELPADFSKFFLEVRGAFLGVPSFPRFFEPPCLPETLSSKLFAKAASSLPWHFLCNFYRPASCFTRQSVFVNTDHWRPFLLSFLAWEAKRASVLLGGPGGPCMAFPTLTQQVTPFPKPASRLVFSKTKPFLGQQSFSKPTNSSALQEAKSCGIVLLFVVCVGHCVSVRCCYPFVCCCVVCAVVCVCVPSE